MTAGKHPRDIYLSSSKAGLCSSDDVCSIVKAVRAAGSEWSLIVSHYLLDGPKGFSELLKAGRPDNLNSRTLSRTLKVLLSRGMVSRTVVSTQPFSVRYSLTEKGRALDTVLLAFRSWGAQWLSQSGSEERAPIIQIRYPPGRKA